MKFITRYPYNNIIVNLKYGWQKEYIPYKPEHTVNLLFLKENKAPEDKGTKELICPFCGEILIVKKYTVYSHYEDLNDENAYYYEPAIDHNCDTINKIEEQILKSEKIEEEIKNIIKNEILPKEKEVNEINKNIKEIKIKNTMIKVSNKTIFKKF
jgi:hypothetical protein